MPPTYCLARDRALALYLVISIASFEIGLVTLSEKRMKTRVLEYTVILHQDEEYGGYWVEVPTLAGCVSQGKEAV
ncbi:MAG TPA: type II toxin-antitoxin system HicB family antitoxin [Dehalococcoidia bacterium]|nr:type II toxin-antitoxin system HicB family antitoxin [Dehalococcoidia bacterium]